MVGGSRNSHERKKGNHVRDKHLAFGLFSTPTKTVMHMCNVYICVFIFAANKLCTKISSTSMTAMQKMLADHVSIIICIILIQGFP